MQTIKAEKLKLKYFKKLDLLKSDKLFQSLSVINRKYITIIGEKYFLTFQELKNITEIVVDFSMWNEPINIKQYISKNIEGSILKIEKEKFINDLNSRWLFLKNAPTKYKKIIKKEKIQNTKKVVLNDTDSNVIGMCPVSSEKTVCCNLLTSDAVQGCTLGCSYCSIQTFYNDDKIAVDSKLKEKLDNIKINPNENYHIGSGQSSDSLAIGNREGVLDAQCSFAKKHSNIIFEFKTKSNNINYFKRNEIPNNVFISWSINPQLFIENEEHGTASMEKRLLAAREIANCGITIGFHFHPMVYYEGWEKDYKDLVLKIQGMFDPSEIGLISMGTLTYIKPAIKKIRTLGIKSKILQLPMEDAVGKVTYPVKTKISIFKTLYESFANWHENVFFYLCMEESVIWEGVFGAFYNKNEDFESALFDNVKKKMDFKKININKGLL